MTKMTPRCMCILYDVHDVSRFICPWPCALGPMASQNREAGNMSTVAASSPWRWRPPRQPLPPLRRALAVLLPVLAPASSKTFSREVLNHYPHPTALPTPRAEHGSVPGMAPNREGDLVPGIFLVGGCASDYLPYLDADGDGEPDGGNGAGGSESESGGVEVQYRCGEVADSTTFYDPAEDFFQPRAPMHHPRHRHATAATDGLLWAIGGRDGSGRVVTKVEAYDPACDRWAVMGELPSVLAVSDAASFVREEAVYVVGGYDGEYRAVPHTVRIDADATLARHGTICRLDGTGGEAAGLVWERRSDLRTARASAVGFSYSRVGYVAGGYTHLDGHCGALASTEVYDTDGDRWWDGPSMGMGRAAAQSAKSRGRLFVVGGETRRPHLGRTGWGAEDLREECPTDPRTLAAHRSSPRRGSRVVDSVEVLDPIEGEGASWRRIGGGLPDGGRRYRFSLLPWPAEDGLYAFGGVSGSDPDPSTTCDGCLHVADDIVVYAIESEEDFYRTMVTTWWADLWVALSLIGLSAAVVSAALQTFPGLKDRFSGRERRRRRAAAAAKGSRDRPEEDEISLVEY